MQRWDLPKHMWIKGSERATRHYPQQNIRGDYDPGILVKQLNKSV